MRRSPDEPKIKGIVAVLPCEFAGLLLLGFPAAPVTEVLMQLSFVCALHCDMFYGPLRLLQFGSRKLHFAVRCLTRWVVARELLARCVRIEQVGHDWTAVSDFWRS